MKFISIQELATYEDQYVALSKDKTEIIVAAKTMKDLEKKLENMKLEGLIIHYVPPLRVAISPVCQ